MYSAVPKIMPLWVSRLPCRATRVVVARFHRRHLGDAEVEDLDEVGLALFFDEVDVLGLEVAVDDAVGVGGGECSTELTDDVADALRWQLAVLLDDRAPGLGLPETPS
jgi:hypothetical protein